MSSRDTRLRKAQLRVLFQVPFFAPGVAKLPVEWDETIETACTDGKRIRFNPKFFDECKDQELCTVLCEEVGHCLLGHLWRAPSGCDWDTWNSACDQAVRNMMKSWAEQRMAGGHADPFPFPRKEQTEPDPKFRQMAEEQIYGQLAQKKPPQQGKGTKPGGGKGGQSGGTPAPGPAGGSGIGQFEKPAGTAQQQKASKTDWQHTFHQSARGRGDLPGDVARMVDQMVNPKVDWWEIIRQWLREQAADDWAWHKPNPYFDDTGFILPSLESERMGPIVFCVDTSGSIDLELLRQFKSEMQNCLDELRPSRLVEICADTRITLEREYRLGDTVAGDAPGGGGTSFIPALEKAGQMTPPPKCVVYLTDADGTFPKVEPEFPVCWVVYGGGKVPWGELVEVGAS